MRQSDEQARPDSGRFRQRERTRRQLIAAARQMLADGETLTVQTVSERTGISRATLYRYFPSSDDLIVQAASPETDDPLRDPAWPYTPDDVPLNLPDRAAALVRTMGEFAFDREAEMRALLRVSLEPDSQQRGLSRQGRVNRHRWIASLLAGLPAEVSRADRDRLAAAMTALFGSDAIVWTTDMAHLTRSQALDVLAWMAKTLVQATLDPAAEDPQRASGPRIDT